MPIPVSEALNLNRYPSFVYWFWKPAVHTNKEYLRQCQFLLNMTPFSHLSHTQRTERGMGGGQPEHRPDQPLVIEQFREVAARCRGVGANFVVQLWGFPIQTREPLTLVRSSSGVTIHGKVSVPAIEGELELLKVYSFWPVGKSGLKGSSLADITSHCSVVHRSGMTTVEGTDPGGRSRRTVCALYIRKQPCCFDPFADDFRQNLFRFLQPFKALSLAGLAVDEHSITGTDKALDFFYGPAADREFRRLTGAGLAEGILISMYRDVDDATRQPRMIHAYLKLLRMLNKEPEVVLYEAIKQFYGPDGFIGFHDTYAEDWMPEEYDGYECLSNDVDIEMWRHGFHHWELPRDFAQVDAINIYPLRFGTSRCCPEPAWLSMFFAKDRTNLLEAATSAAFGGRIHWHAFNDKGGWGLDLQTEDREREAIARAERVIRLLNAVQASQPRSDILVLMGYNASLTWQPGYDDFYYTETFDLSHYLFRAGHVNDLVPSYEVAKGRVRMAEDGTISYGRASYKAVIWTAPQFAEPETVELMRAFVRSGGKLWIIGPSCLDDQGMSIGNALTDVLAGAQSCFAGFPHLSSISTSLEQAGFARATDGSFCRYIDGSVVWADGNSFWDNAPHPVKIQVGSAGMIKANAVGLLGVKLDEDQRLEWIVSGPARQVLLNDKPVVDLDQPCSFVYRKSGTAKLLRAQSETDRVSLNGRVGGIAFKDVSLAIRVEHVPDGAIVIADVEAKLPGVEQLKLLLQPLADWQVQPRWEQRVEVAGVQNSWQVRWELKHGRDLIHKAADIQVLGQLEMCAEHVELYVRKRIDG